MKQKILILLAFLGVGLIGLLLGTYMPKFQSSFKKIAEEKKLEEERVRMERLTAQVLPKDGFELSVSWSDFGPKLIKAGVIDQKKFEDAVQATDEQKKILTEGSDEKIKINSSNSQFVVDFLWALGLAQNRLFMKEVL